MLIEMVPLLLLFEGSLVLTRVLGRPREGSAAAPEVPPGPSGEAA
jgi:Sec-independent protein secretion pathway component TatC